jgi:hypothetical protein
MCLGICGDSGITEDAEIVLRHMLTEFSIFMSTGSNL